MVLRGGIKVATLIYVAVALAEGRAQFCTLDHGGEGGVLVSNQIDIDTF